MLNFRNAFIENLSNPKINLEALKPTYTSIEELKKWTKDRHGMADVILLENKLKEKSESILEKEDGAICEV